jgi:hypothetical protein
MSTDCFRNLHSVLFQMYVVERDIAPGIFLGCTITWKVSST